MGNLGQAHRGERRGARVAVASRVTTFILTLILTVEHVVQVMTTYTQTLLSTWCLHSRSHGAPRRMGFFETASRIHAERGVKGFFAGWGPRSLRAAPACAIVLGTYDSFKMWLAHHV